MPSRFVVFSVAWFAGLGLLACYGGSEGDAAHDGAGASKTDPQGGGATASTTVPGSDLSCELATFLANRCQECHGVKPAAGATLSFLGRADLVAPFPDDPSKTVADEMLARMSDPKSPMPPSPKARATAAEIALVKGWIDAGKPVQSCAAADVPPPPPSADDPFATASVCASNRHWTNGDSGSDEMHPGRACLSCHAFPSGAFFKAPFDVAGTVYPTGHAPDDCDGSSGVTVVITDAKGTEYRLDTNAAGNFGHSSSYGLQKIAMPYRAKVVRGGNERVMTDPQTDGDCNHCHTEAGTQKAPGRILAP